MKSEAAGTRPGSLLHTVLVASAGPTQHSETEASPSYSLAVVVSHQGLWNP